MDISFPLGRGRALGPDRLLSWAKVREKLQLGQEGQGRTMEWFIRTMAHLVAGLAALVAGRVARGLRAVGAQVARLAAVEALAVHRGTLSLALLPRLRACRRDVPDFAAVVARLAAGAGVAAGGHLGHAFAQGVHVAQLRTVALQVARLAALVANLGRPSTATATTAATALRAVALQVTDLAADVASLGALLGRDAVDTVREQRHSRVRGTVRAPSRPDVPCQ